jgi:hypothetical protein
MTTITIDRATVQQALEALRRIAGLCYAEPLYKIARAAIKALEGEK